MLLLLLMIIVIFIKKEGKIFFLLFSLQILHAFILYVIYGTPFAGSDTLYYFNESRSISNILNDFNFKYAGYKFLNYLYTFPFIDLSDILASILIRASNLCLWIITISRVKKILRKFYLIILYIIAFWFAIYNLRDGIIALLLINIFVDFAIYKKNLAYFFVVYYIPFLLFKFELFVIIIFSIVLSKIIQYLIKSRFILLLFPILLINSIIFLPLPDFSKPYIAAILIADESDKNEYNDDDAYSNLEISFTDDPQSVSKSIISRYNKRIISTIYRSSPFKGIFFDLKFTQTGNALNLSVFSISANILIRLLYSFFFLPLLLIVGVSKKLITNRELFNKYYVLYVSFIMGSAIYIIKFGNVQDRIIWAFLPPFLLIFNWIKDQKLMFSYLEKINLFVLFPMHIAYLLLLLREYV